MTILSSGDLRRDITEEIAYQKKAIETWNAMISDVNNSDIARMSIVLCETRLKMLEWVLRRIPEKKSLWQRFYDYTQQE